MHASFILIEILYPLNSVCHFPWNNIFVIGACLSFIFGLDIYNTKELTQIVKNLQEKKSTGHDEINNILVKKK